VRLDQGVSYWEVSRSVDDRNKYFDFLETSSIQQAKALRQTRLLVEGGDFPTHLFVQVIE